MQHVIDNRQRDSALIFQVDLWDPNGEVPLDIPSAFLRGRRKSIAPAVSTSQLSNTRKWKNIDTRYAASLTDSRQYQNDPDAKFLEQEARVKTATIVQLKYQSKKYEVSGKTFEFSRRAMEEHWQAGYEDTNVALGEPEVLEPPSVGEALRIFYVRQGWMK